MGLWTGLKEIGRKIGIFGRDAGRISAKAWHIISPIINISARLLADELRSEGLALARDIVAKYALKDINDEDKRERAFKEIVAGLKKAGISAKDHAINLAIEMFVAEING